MLCPFSFLTTAMLAKVPLQILAIHGTPLLSCGPKMYSGVPKPTLQLVLYDKQNGTHQIIKSRRFSSALPVSFWNFPAVCYEPFTIFLQNKCLEIQEDGLMA